MGVGQEERERDRREESPRHLPPSPPAGRPSHQLFSFCRQGKYKPGGKHLVVFIDLNIHAVKWHLMQIPFLKSKRCVPSVIPFVVLMAVFIRCSKHVDMAFQQEVVVPGQETSSKISLQESTAKLGILSTCNESYYISHDSCATGHGLQQVGEHEVLATVAGTMSHRAPSTYWVSALVSAICFIL